MVLLDSHAIIHRAYHALPEFSSSKGVPTGALYGLTTMLLGIIEKFKPEYLVACYDLPQPTHRHIAYEAYKAGRRKTDDALALQLESSRKLFEAFGVPIYDLPGFEADDMLGTIVEQVCHTRKKTDPDGSQVKIVIASGDMDTLQLVTGDDVVVYTLKKGIKDIVVYDELAVIDRFGFGPKLLPDYKGLRGDPSDNIIGIAGIGEKTASILINTFGTIEDMYALLDKDAAKFHAKLKDAKITERIAGLLVNGRDDAIFSKTLATIRTDAPIDFKYENAHWEPHLDKIDELFKELEFRGLAVRVKQLFGKENGVASEGSAVGAGESSGAEKTVSKKKKKSGDESNEDTAGTKKIKVEEPERYPDASPGLREKMKVATFLLNSNKTNPTLEDVYIETGEDSADKAYEILIKKISENGLDFVFNNIEVPIIPIIHEMTTDGAMIDIKYLKKLSDEFHKKLNQLEKEIHELAGMEFNVASPKQLGEVIFEKLNLAGAGTGKKIKKTAGGASSTKESELEKLRDSHPIIGKVLEYRELAKLLGTYIDVFPTLADKNDRIHASFSQTGAATGRMSSHNPGLQNVPIKTELGKKVRHAFIAPKGRKLISIDYSQIELRVAAILSGDKNLVEIFKNGTDVHTGVASRVFKVDEKDVTRDMRRQAKVINFGILYGMGVTALRQNLAQGGSPVSREEAQNFYSEYFNTFNGIASYLEEVKRTAMTLGYTKTMFGRRRYFEGIKSKLPFIRAAAERMAINAPVQGTATADLIKLAMRYVAEILTEKTDTKLTLQIHDELVFEAPAASAEKMAEEIKKVMENVLTRAFEEYKKLGAEYIVANSINDGGDTNSRQYEFEKHLKEVPILVSVGVGDNWGEI